MFMTVLVVVIGKMSGTASVTTAVLFAIHLVAQPNPTS